LALSHGLRLDDVHQKAGALHQPAGVGAARKNAVAQEAQRNENPDSGQIYGISKQLF